MGEEALPRKAAWGGKQNFIDRLGGGDQNGLESGSPRPFLLSLLYPIRVLLENPLSQNFNGQDFGGAGGNRVMRSIFHFSDFAVYNVAR